MDDYMTEKQSLASKALTTHVMCFWFGLCAVGIMIPPFTFAGMPAMFNKMERFRPTMEKMLEEASKKSHLNQDNIDLYNRCLNKDFVIS